MTKCHECGEEKDNTVEVCEMCHQERCQYRWPYRVHICKECKDKDDLFSQFLKD